MNKKIISILLIFSLLAVSLTSISANETTIDEQNVADMQTGTQEETNTTNTEQSANNVTTQNNTTYEPGEYPDVVVPTNTSKLEDFNILMNFVTPEGLNYFADRLAEIDEATYKDVITALRNNDREHLLSKVGELNQNKIDVFFDEFLKLFDTNYQENNNNNNNPINIITNTASQIFGSQGTNSNDQSSNNVQSNNYIKINKNNSNQPSQNNPMFSYNGKYYSMIDFVKLLSSLYEKGDITSAQFIQALEENGIDTSEIKVENGIINWGYLHIIPQNVDVESVVNETNNTTVNNTTTETQVENTSSNTDSNSASSEEVKSTESNTESAK